MKIALLSFVLLSTLLLSACPVRNPYVMDEYMQQDSYNAIFKGKEIPKDMR